MKIALWGSYDHGNFGDDLMAEIFAREIARQGHEVTLISNNPLLDDAENSYLRGSLSGWEGDLVVVGGGAMLSSESRLRFYLSRASRDVEKEFRSLLNFTQAANVPVMPISIGGDGVSPPAIMGSRHRFFASNVVQQGTVRLRADVDMAESVFGLHLAYYPDILFATNRLISNVARPDRIATKPRIGVNVNEKKVDGEFRRLVEDLSAWSEVVYLTTHSSHFNRRYELRPNGAEAISYETLPDFLAGLAALDLVISDKLHVGAVAASYGVPFLSYKGRGKVRRAHEELGLSEAIVTSSEHLSTLLLKWRDAGNVRTLADSIPANGLDQEAMGHLLFLKSRL
ncbi:polysaccharide pyruvyl transferase family protein [Microbacterium sp. 179-I 1D1 NHS]|uniref:polysaccharide pyruvyl transferase family protein n=1 Tax=unclassified Microbacterium TaxID=2609290 RepID=UPI003879D8A0